MSNANNNVIMEPPPLNTPLFDGAGQLDVRWAGWFNSLKMSSGSSPVPPAPGIWPQNAAPQIHWCAPVGTINGTNNTFTLPPNVTIAGSLPPQLFLTNPARVTTLQNQWGTSQDFRLQFGISAQEVIYTTAPATSSMHEMWFWLGGPYNYPVVCSSPGQLSALPTLTSSANWFRLSRYLLPGDVLLVSFFGTFTPGTAAPTPTCADNLGNTYTPLITLSDTTAGTIAGVFQATISPTGYVVENNPLAGTVTLSAGAVTMCSWVPITNTNGKLDGAAVGNANSLNPPAITTSGNVSEVIIFSFRGAGGDYLDPTDSVSLILKRNPGTLIARAEPGPGWSFAPQINCGVNSDYSFCIPISAQVD